MKTVLILLIINFCFFGIHELSVLEIQKTTTIIAWILVDTMFFLFLFLLEIIKIKEGNI